MYNVNNFRQRSKWVSPDRSHNMWSSSQGHHQNGDRPRSPLWWWWWPCKRWSRCPSIQHFGDRERSTHRFLSSANWRVARLFVLVAFLVPPSDWSECEPVRKMEFGGYPGLGWTTWILLTILPSFHALNYRCKKRPKVADNSADLDLKYYPRRNNILKI